MAVLKWVESWRSPDLFATGTLRASAILKLHVRAAWPEQRSVLDAFCEHAGVTHAAEIQTFHGFAYRSDLDQFLEDAELSSAVFCRGEAEKRPVLTLSRDEG